MEFINAVFSNTAVTSIVLVLLQSVLMPRMKGCWPIFILPVLTLIGGEYLVWGQGKLQNTVLGSFVVIGLASLLTIMGMVSKNEISKTTQAALDKKNLYN
ncbi:hypothetical protein [Weissella confusa]|uniref:hypothetical protein n=1 Tax=Weissella confusa TaxID=1583 RepID=UPI0022E38F08|nr:hypothetical protein [Weissella confusa]